MDDIQILQDKIGQSITVLKNKLRRSEHIYHEDAGHGWLKVPKSLLAILGIADQITGYSYEYMGQAYLEEDQDAVLYMKTLFPEGFNTETYRQFRDLYIKVINDGDESNIRNFQSFKS